MAGWLEILSLVLTLIAASWGCVTAISPERSPDELSERSAEPLSLEDLIGVWKGGSLCYMGRIGTSCRGTVNIAFTFVPAVRSKMTGFYRCETGTVGCRNRLENGAIARVDMNGKRLWLRVMLGDGSSCLFTSKPERDRMAGGYECLQGGAVVEEGWWWIERSY